MPGQNDIWPWLQSIMQNQGAAQPSNPAAYPAAAPQAMPGTGPMAMSAMTPGGPSMGYPALGQPGPQPQPPQAPPPSPLGSSVEVNPHGDGPPDVMSPAAMAAAQAAAQPQPPQPVQGGQGGMPFPQDLGPASRNMPFVGSAANSGQYDPRGYFAPTPPGSPSATPRPAKGPLSAAGGGGATMKRTPGAPNLGYYQGNNNRFIGIAQPNASPQNSMRAGPQATALNLAGLFGGRGQPAAAPAAGAAAGAGPLAGGGMVPSTYPGDNWDIDAQGNVVPNYGSPPGTTGPLQRPPKSSVARARILAPNYYG